MEASGLLLKTGQAEGKFSGIKVSRTIKILYLLFVDDFLIMTNGSLLEWLEIKEFLHKFYNATGLLINWEKSTFLHANLQLPNLDKIKGLFPYTFSPLSSGLNYLGYHLNSNSYKPSDCIWLLPKVGKMIGHWCTRWLTLGG